MKIKQDVIKVLRLYKPLDVRLRENSWYELMSFYFFNMARRVLGLPRIGSQKIIEHHYIKNLGHIQVQPRTMLFDSFQGQKLAGDPYAVYREVVRQGVGYLIVWVKRPNTYLPIDVQQNKNIKLVDYNTKSHAEALLYSQVFVFNMNLPHFFVKRAGQLLVNTWHGVPIKTLGLDIDQPLRMAANTQRSFNISDILTIASQYEYDKTVGACGAELGDYTIVDGSPRIDVMLNADKEAFRRQLGVGADIKLVLYAPTWRGVGAVSVEISDQISAITELQAKLGSGYEVVVSLHHFTQEALDKKNIKVNQVPRSIDTTEILQAVDILVSDYSSIALDFLLLDKPMVLFVADYQKYTSERGLYFGLNELPARLAYNISELVNCVREGVKPSDFSDYKDVLQRFFGSEDGRSSARVVEQIRLRLDGAIGPSSGNLKRIVVFPGALQDNGITSSLKSLVDNLAGGEYRIILLVDTRYQRTVGGFNKNLSFFKGKCELLLIDRDLPKYGMISLAYKKYLASPASMSGEEIALLDKAFAQEASRILGGIELYAAIDFSGYDHYWTYFISMLNARRKVVLLHSDMKAEYDNPNKSHSRLKNIFSRYDRFDVVASVSDALRMVNENELSSYFGLHKSATVVNTLSLDRIRQSAEVPLGFLLPNMGLLGAEVTKFVIVGRASPEKNIKLAIDSFDVVARSHDCVLFIVGDGPLRNQLTDYVQTKENSARMMFAGHMNNPYPVIRAADCLLMTSHYEGQSLVLLEAMTLGTYCIASDIPAARSVLSGTGCLVVPPNVKSFSEAMSSFISDNLMSTQFDADAYNANALAKLKDIIEN